MKTDVNGISTCPPGHEHYETYRSPFDGQTRIQYDYRHSDGRLFSTTARSLDTCRLRRDSWLKEMK